MADSDTSVETIIQAPSTVRADVPVAISAHRDVPPQACRPVTRTASLYSAFRSLTDAEAA